MARISITRALAVLAAAASFPTASAGQPSGPVDIDPDSLRPGIAAVYRSLGAGGATVHTVESKLAFTIGDSSPHPRIPRGPFEVIWHGLLKVQDTGPITFHARLGGELALRVDGIPVFNGSGQAGDAWLSGSQTLTRPPGLYRMKGRYRSIAGIPARLQLSWEGPGFAREPVPAWRFAHLSQDLPARQAADRLAAEGRAAVERFGCVRCHRDAFPAVSAPSPGPSLADAGRRLRRAWLTRWLANPQQVRPGARMPALFAPDRAGFAERSIVSDYLTRDPAERPEDSPPGDHRAGRLAFLGLGCVACHLVPDLAVEDDPERVKLDSLGDRMSASDIAAFLGNPHARYPDGRMPRLPVSPGQARDIAAYLLFWSRPSTDPPSSEGQPSPDELRSVARRLGVPARDRAAIASALIAVKGCTSCHVGLGPTLPRDVPIRPGNLSGCLSARDLPRFGLDGPIREAIRAYLAVAGQEKYRSTFDERRRRLESAGCVRCHQRDSDLPPPIERIAQSLGGSFLQTLPYQRTPRLTNPCRKLTRDYLARAVREGLSGLRGPEYTYRMPAYGAEAEALVRALEEADGEVVDGAEPPSRPIADPTIGTLAGPILVGSQGYGCISCHVWDGRQISQADPGAVGPDLTRLVGRIRRDWFEQFLEEPIRWYPNTPMPAIFPHGRGASLSVVLDGDPARQKEALWGYFSLGRDAPAPRPPPPFPIDAPAVGGPPLVAQVPIRMPDGTAVESLCLLTGQHDLLVYDLQAGVPRGLFVGAEILRIVQGRTRQFLASSTPAGAAGPAESGLALVNRGTSEPPETRVLLGYDRLADGVRIRSRATFKAGFVEIEETLKVFRDAVSGRCVRELRASGIPDGAALLLPTGLPADQGPGAGKPADASSSLRLPAGPRGTAVATLSYPLPPAVAAPPWREKLLANPNPDSAEGKLERPGYRAIAYPRPKTISGEDRVMPGALAVDPREGRLLVASLKTGELFRLTDPLGDGRNARFDNYAGGLFQDVYGMLAGTDGLYVLHRRNLTRVLDEDGDGTADRFDRIAALPHGVADTYDYAYGLVRDKTGGFILSYAPYANRTMPGSGGVLCLAPGKPPREVAFGLRNPLGWCVGPEGEVFFTDNQGEWVATNKLCHLKEGGFYGFPNPEQKEHVSASPERPAVWIPYGWARSINGVAFDDTGGKFGPFAGQFFLAELMFGGAIIRASVERVNGQYQGACFPFWGKGLLGPVCLAFDPRGLLYVGGITEPGWMAQPDRGAVFRIDYTGRIPFEMRSIHARPRGFRIVFTSAADARSASEPASYRLEKFRYEYTGAYGSPELDRATVAISRASLSSDGLAVELSTGTLEKDRVYLLSAPGVRSSGGERLVHATGAYTLNEIPRDAE
jgi:cytochrome c551/c552